jgi:DNA-binding NarL/FixJ family response regulator
MAKDILLVEDHPSVAKSTKLYFEQVMGPEGTVLIAGCADTAMGLLRAEPTRWRLILLDLGIPGAVGLSLAMQIKALGLAPITCICSGEDPRTYVETVRQEGFLGYVPKASADFVQAFKAVLAGQPSFPW